MKYLLLIAIALGLPACATAIPTNPYAADGRACRNVGYSFNPIFLDDRTGRAC